MSETREYLHKIYLSWVNKFLTIGQFARYHGLTVSESKILIELSKAIFERNE